MVKRHRPRRGSLAFSPRKRAKSETCKIRREKIVEGRVLQGFVGYKAGMTHIVMIDDVPNSLTYGTEIAVPVTVIETPPIKVKGVRLYENTVYGKKTVTEVWVDKTDGYEEKLKNLEELVNNLNDKAELRLIIFTSPEVVKGVPKKKPEILEIKMSGNAKGDLEYAKEVLGGTIRVKDVLKEGDFVDVTAVTKGKGTQGPVKRWGVAIQGGKAERSSKGRHVGSPGPWIPSKVSWRVPQLGQTGYHQRTEYNKRVLKIGDNGEEITPKGGFIRYGVVKNEYVLLKGSVPGPKKRLIRMNLSIRPHPTLGSPNIVYISTESQQGC
ncbi:MAG: 50S ribosomal protein L3 [Candidatus Methanospirareceae archaeon]